VIARNDGSANTERLESSEGHNVGLRPNGSGKDLFTQFSEQGEFLDVAR
jgi:hypothetical protein